LTKIKESDINKSSRIIYNTIGNNIIRLRGKLIQEELSKKAGISRITLSAIDNGRSISLKNLIKIAKALDVNVADLFISDKDREEVSYMHILLLKKASESLNIKPR